MKQLLFLLMITGGLFLTQAQLTVLSVERLPVSLPGLCNSPRFSPDGEKIYFTNAGYNGIWEYTIADGEVRRITDDPSSGFNFVLSEDGSEIAYRTTTMIDDGRNRRQDIIRFNLNTEEKRVVASGEDVMTPVYYDNTLLYSIEGESFSPVESMNGYRVLGIDYTKIILAGKEGRVIFDPLGDGSYIWPRLSPDGTRLVASDMSRGVFITGLNGENITMLGKRNAPCWTRDGSWIIYMNDKDDGHNILSSDIMAVSADGQTTLSLTETADIIEMYPDCSPVDNSIVCSSLDGGLYLIRYGE